MKENKKAFGSDPKAFINGIYWQGGYLYKDKLSTDAIMTFSFFS